MTMMTSLLLLFFPLLVFLSLEPVESFILKTRTNHLTRAPTINQKPPSETAIAPPNTKCSVLMTTISTTMDTPTPVKITMENAAQELLTILVDRETNERSQQPTTVENEKNRIESLIETLVNYKCSFDPQVLGGPFFATVYSTGGASPPLWETLGKGKKNVKGQRYTLLTEEENEDEDDDGEQQQRGNVLNYAEIFGKGLHIAAYGNFSKTPSPSSNEKTIATTAPSSSPLDNLLSFFNPTTTTTTKSLFTCPVEFDVEVTKGSICIMGKSIDIPISGLGKLRVLYADPLIRIFISPTDTTGGTKWESSGLVVVQVRGDLIGEGMD